MAVHLVRNEIHSSGYQEAQGAVPDRSMVPWAVTRDGRVVWSAKVKGLGAPAARTGLIAYSPQVQRERRALAETALACIILANPQYCGAVLNTVSQAMYRYWIERKKQLDILIAEWGMREQRKYAFGDTSFGRLGKSNEIPSQMGMEIQTQIAALFGNYIPRILNVHDNFLRLFKLFGPTDMGTGPKSRVWSNPGLTDIERRNVVSLWKRTSLQWQKMEKIGEQVRPKELFDPSKRGRIDVTPAPGPTSVAGTLPQGTTALDMQACMARLNLRTMEDRKRGVDLYLPDSSKKTSFLTEVDKFNLNFGAGPSGTTGTLFQSAIVFADLNCDGLQKYLLAIIAYLVGGGMHTCHEIFTVAKLLGIPYETGRYYSTMPAYFRSTPLYDAWQTEFWEIVGPVNYFNVA
jgi:hypothetical protein